MNNLGIWFHIKFQRMNEYFSIKFKHFLFFIFVFLQFKNK
jgi:hypothetical protein